MDFSAPYNQSTALEFLRNLLPNDFTASSGGAVDIGFTPQLIQNVTLLGTVPSLNDLKIYEVRHSSENDPRVTLSRESFRLLAKHSVRKALIFFITDSSPNYRFSLVTVDLDWKDGGRIKREYSNPRRQSFLLGPKAKVRTPQSFLETQGRVSDAKDLADRFSVEVVNKEFYKQIAKLFMQLTGGKMKMGNRTETFETTLELPSNHKPNPETLDSFLPFQEFAVRLIGRCIFCWFLRQKKTSNGKPLIPESMLSMEAVSGTPSYYHLILEKLFFEVLNKPREQRSGDVPDGSDDVPFLNGGLFDPHPEDFYHDGKWNGALKVPDEWLRELFGLLETYNFTIDENTPVDTELSVDPEMLGRIFENLLAEINPETGESARKHTGSYYTPREIVEYMVNESLTLYLKEKTVIDTDRLASLLSYGEEDGDLKASEKRAVIAALEQLKIIDPACGSGAFPLGILHKMVLVLQKVDPAAEQWLRSLLDSIPDVTAREVMRRKLEDDKDLWDYTRKLGAIRRSIYGVDIQPIGVEITKLRCFLSLVVDEKINDRKQNRGIEPLPNLEFKFVCANSLFSLPSAPARQQQQLFEDDAQITQLKNWRERYFVSSGKEKLVIENKFRAVQQVMFERGLQSWRSAQAEDTRAAKLAEWKPFSNERSEWFDPEWMFGVKDGFDIVIANPPYVRQEHIPYKEDIKDAYEVGSGTADLYCYFYELGWRLLKERGILTFITSNKYLRAAYGKKLKKLLKTKMIIHSLIDFGDSPVFEVTAYPSILVAQKGQAKDARFSGCTIETEEELINFSHTLQQKSIYQKQDDLPEDDAWNIETSEIAELKKKIEGTKSSTKRLEDYVGGDIFYGIKTGYQNAFVIDAAKREQLIKEDKHNAAIIKPYLRGKDIVPYATKESGLFLIFVPWHFPLHERSDVSGASLEAEKEFRKRYPALYKHLLQFKKPLVERNKQETGVRYEWYALQRCAASYPKAFDKPKIISPRFMIKPSFGYDTSGAYTNDACYFIPSEDLYLLGIINSNVAWYYLSEKCCSVQNDYSQIHIQFLSRVPIRIPSAEQKAAIEKKVKQILKKKSEGIETDTSDIENEMNQIVYEIYGLDDKERKFIGSLTS